MKKICTLFLLICALFLMSCGNASGEISYLEDVISHLETERDSLIDEINSQALKIADLHNAITESEEKVYASIDDDILNSFMENLPSVAKFIGVDDLYVAVEDITQQGHFITASSESFIGGRIQLTFRYWVWQDDIRWVLLEYSVGAIVGSGTFDGGHAVWQWQQEGMFDESFVMRFYSYEDIWPEPIGEYAEQEIVPYNWQSQIIEHMRTHKDIRIINLWYEESRLVVDITPASAVPFNWGSFGGAVRSRALIDSLASMPNVTEVEILVGGQRGVSADHFSFAGAFRVN